MEKILISACLLGINCRYDGRSSELKDVLELRDKYDLIPVCPEILGGLATPRDPAEIIGDKVINSSWQDVSKEYKKGAEETLKIAKLLDVKKALLKSKSPSCGRGLIYDGSFSGNKIKGNGITSQLLLENNIEVISSYEWEELK